jgi:hypothetical protein
MQFELFVDPRYNAEAFIEIDPRQISRIQETTKRLFLGAVHDVTIITMNNGEQHILAGHMKTKLQS